MTQMSIEEHHAADSGAGPYAITTGPDGALWFTEQGGNRVGSITPDGTVTVHDLPTLGCDDALWTALEINVLARIASVDSAT